MPAWSWLSVKPASGDERLRMALLSGFLEIAGVLNGGGWEEEGRWSFEDGDWESGSR